MHIYTRRLDSWVYFNKDVMIRAVVGIIHADSVGVFLAEGVGEMLDAH